MTEQTAWTPPRPRWLLFPVTCCQLMLTPAAVLTHQTIAQPQPPRPALPVLAAPGAHRSHPPAPPRPPRCRGPPARPLQARRETDQNPTTTDRATTDPKEAHTAHRTRRASRTPNQLQHRHAEKARVIAKPMSSTYSYRHTQVGKFD